MLNHHRSKFKIKFLNALSGSPDPKKKMLKCPSQALHMLTLDGKGERETPDERGINTEIKKLDTFFEKDKTPNHDSVVIVQDDRMGFHICIVGY